MILKITSYLTLAFMMNSHRNLATPDITLHLMTFQQAQRLNALLNEDGYHAWAVDGFSVNLLLDGVLYNIQTAERQPNEK